MSVTPDVVAANRAAVAGRFPDLFVAEAISGPSAVVCGGPSASDSLDFLRNFPGRIIACNGAHDWLIDAGVVPWAGMIIDPDPWMSNVINRPRGDVRYILADHVSRALAAKLDPYQVRTVRIALSTLEADGSITPGEGLSGGCTVGLRAINAAIALGSREVNVVGMDGCYHADQHHAYQEIQPGGDVVEVTLGADGVRFRVAPWMIAQHQDMMSESANGWARDDLEIIFHGRGLTQATAALLMQQGHPSIRIFQGDQDV
jgi:uncharacterized Rossmann fold enzyme